MNPFLKEHALPLVGSTLLHAVLVAGALFLALVTITPKLIPPAAIEAYVAARPAPKPAAAPEPPATPAPTPDPKVAEEAARRKAEELRIADYNRQVDLAARKAAEAEAARDAKRKSEAAEAARRKLDEARRKADAAAAAKRKADAAQLLARESDLARQLAAEEHRAGAEHAGLLAQYIAELQARIERAWNRPPTAKAGLSCTVFVSQVPGGTVTNVKLGACNGDAAVQQSITLAVYRASPLPAPPDPSLFERNLRLIFEPQ